MQLRWSHAAVLVEDMEGMLDFYTRVLGFRITDRGPLGSPDGPEIVFMSQVDTDHHQLAFLATEQRPEEKSVHHFAFRVGSLDDVKEMNEMLRADGRATGLTPLTHGNAWSVYFTDPEGNGIEVFCDTPWHVQQPQATPWQIDEPNDQVIAWTRSKFEGEPEFGPIENFYARKREELSG